MPDDLLSASPGVPSEGPAPAKSLADLLVDHMPSLEAFIRLNLGPALRTREETQDLMQSVCREVLEHAGSFEYRGNQAFRGWLFTRCLYKIQEKARYHQAAKRDHRITQAADPSDQILQHYKHLSSPSEGMRSSEFIDMLEDAFARLQPAQQQAVALSRIAKLPYSEIAQILDKSEEGVRSLVHRGLARLSGFLPKE